MSRKNGILKELKSVFAIEIQALQSVMKGISSEFVRAVETISDCRRRRGRVIVTGIGKSGLIANKIAATLTSTGTPAVFVHAMEALHGDIGIVSAGDVLIAIGKSGENAELITLLPLVKKIGAKIIAITASSRSRMAMSADIVLELQIPREACPLNLAPTASTTASLVLGDAIAVALMKLNKESTADFARRHPGGQLGRRLLLQVGDVMRRGTRNPVVKIDDSVRHMIILITEGQAGAVSVIGKNSSLAGLVCDYDVRKVLERGEAVLDLKIRDIMNPGPEFVYQDQMATEALDLMRLRKKPITVLPVLSRTSKVVGMVTITDLISAGI